MIDYRRPLPPRVVDDAAVDAALAHADKVHRLWLARAQARAKPADIVRLPATLPQESTP